MKKQLLTTTAMVTAGIFAVSGAALAKKPTLTVGGSTEQIFGIGSNADDFDAANGQRAGFDQQSDTEVHFKGSVTLDNGIKIKTRTELEGNSAGGAGAGDNIDENWMRISGSFGEIRLGSGDAAGQVMTTGYLGTWSTGVGQLLAFDTTDWITRPGTVSASTVGRVDLSSDAEQISYYTPRMSGLQLGVSYIPSDNEDVNNSRPLNTAGDRDGFSMGLNYVGKFNGAGVGLAVGYATEDETTAGVSNREVWAVGGRIDFQGIRIGMSFQDLEEQHNETTNVTTAAGQETFEIGLRYTMGKDAFSITHLNAETNATQSTGLNGDETEVTALAYRRVLGPGVFWKVTASFADFSDGATAAANSASNDGEAIATTIQVRF
jgi:hypothetical protein